jgi:hypothetical protein
MTGPRDWDKELAEIDKLMGAEAPAPGKVVGPPVARPSETASRPGQSSAPQVARQQVVAPQRRVANLTVWLVALLGPIGAAGLAIWPYPKACGMGLGVYLVGVLAVWGASIWAMRTAWAAQRAAAMILAVLALLASLSLAALEVLPRVGYARTSLTWTCSN